MQKKNAPKKPQPQSRVAIQAQADEQSTFAAVTGTADLAAPVKKLPFEVCDEMPEKDIKEGADYLLGIMYLRDNPKKKIAYPGENPDKLRQIQASILTTARSHQLEITTSKRVGKVWVELTPDERKKQFARLGIEG